MSFKSTLFLIDIGHSFRIFGRCKVLSIHAPIKAGNWFLKTTLTCSWYHRTLCFSCHVSEAKRGTFWFDDSWRGFESRGVQKGLSELLIPIYVELKGKERDGWGKSDILGDNHITSFPYLRQKNMNKDKKWAFCLPSSLTAVMRKKTHSLWGRRQKWSSWGRGSRCRKFRPCHAVTCRGDTWKTYSRDF